MKISTQILLDSISPAGARITTMLCIYPRFIHSEVMTHRVFSRNAASSRAIPTQKILDMVDQSPVIPEHWGKLQKGMQAEEEVDPETQEAAKIQWLQARREAMNRVQNLLHLGIHKQIANRILEPWMWMATVITATEWENFFQLRVSKYAQPEFQRLAFTMLRAYVYSKPVMRETHMPLADEDRFLSRYEQQMVSAARCARISYFKLEPKPFAEELKLAESLAVNRHMSPFEHQAEATVDPKEQSGNFKGWHQHRKDLPFEAAIPTNLEQLYEQFAKDHPDW